MGLWVAKSLSIPYSAPNTNIYYTSVFLIPHLTIPAMAMGKNQLYWLPSWAVFHQLYLLCLFQLAVYNTKTIPWAKITGRQNSVQDCKVWLAAPLRYPIAALCLASNWLGETTTSWVLSLSDWFILMHMAEECIQPVYETPLAKHGGSETVDSRRFANLQILQLINHKS